MSLENVKVFMEKLSQDKELANKLAAADKGYSEKHSDISEGLTDAQKEEAVKAILLPIAKEAGLEFSFEELKTFEENQIENIDETLSEDELAVVAGGSRKKRKFLTTKDGLGVTACMYLGVGIGSVKGPDGKRLSFCLGLGGTKGGAARACFIKGLKAN
jgi:hypothetical protein